MAKIGPDWNILTYMLCRLNLQRPLVFTDKAPPKKLIIPICISTVVKLNTLSLLIKNFPNYQCKCVTHNAYENLKTLNKLKISHFSKKLCAFLQFLSLALNFGFSLLLYQFSFSANCTC